MNWSKNIIIIAVFSASFFVFVSNARADYYAEGNALSTNLLSGLTDVAQITEFTAAAAIPANTAASVQFSQDQDNWYNHNGIEGGWDALSAGSNSIDLGALDFTTADFYYKLKFTAADPVATPSVSEVAVIYSDTYTPWTPPWGTGYYAEGYLVSADLLPEAGDVFDGSKQYFAWDISSLPSGTAVSVQFSTDSVSWYNSSGTLWGWDSLSVGRHFSSESSLSLDSLDWDGAENFYYKLKFTTNDSANTPALNEAGLLVLPVTRVVFAPDPGQQTDFGSAVPIYRSVGPNNTAALAAGTSNSLTIAGSTATFAFSLPDRIGVGDAIQYDSDNDGAPIDANDSIVFIHSRINSKTYTVKTASGGVPTAVATDNDWSIFRAYTSLSLAEAGTENTGIDSDLRNFDTWTNGKDLTDATGSNEVWNIACYGDAADTTAVTIDGWTTDADNFIRIYTPVSKQEVGVSQRHDGKWNTGKYRLETTISNFHIAENFVCIDGLQFKSTAANESYKYTVNFTDTVENGAEHRISNCIFWAVLSGTANNIYAIRTNWFAAGTRTLKVWNNIVYDYVNGAYTDIYTFDSNAGWNSYMYNNTVYNSHGGFRHGSSGILIVKNNIYQSEGISGADGYNNESTGSNYNLSDIASDAIGANSRNSTTVTFVDAANKDFHLASNDAGARNYGTDLSGDANLPFSTDIDGQTRPGESVWDIGADEKPANTVIKGGMRITK